MDRDGKGHDVAMQHKGNIGFTTPKVKGFLCSAAWQSSGITPPG
jgi:hypothetical protein